MEEKERPRKIGSEDYVTRVEWVEEKSKIYAYVNKKTEENKDKIDTVKDRAEEIHDIHVEKNNELLRRQDKYEYQMQNLTKNLGDLNVNIVNLTNTLSRHGEEIGDVKVTLRETKGSMITKSDIESTKKAEEEKRKAELYKLLGIVIPALIGAGGLLSWLGPLLF